MSLDIEANAAIALLDMPDVNDDAAILEWYADNFYAIKYALSMCEDELTETPVPRHDR